MIINLHLFTDNWFIKQSTITNHPKTPSTIGFYLIEADFALAGVHFHGEVWITTSSPLHILLPRNLTYSPEAPTPIDRPTVNGEISPHSRLSTFNSVTATIRDSQHYELLCNVRRARLLRLIFFSSTMLKIDFGFRHGLLRVSTGSSTMFDAYVIRLFLRLIKSH